MIPFPQDKKFSIIYADPPWSYENKTNLTSDREYESHITDHYQTMTFDDIYNLPIQTISKENCLLFLWIVSPNLLEGIETGRRWGFNYITVAFVWNKIHVLPGHYTMSQCELCLLFKKGKIPLPRGSRNEKQFLETSFNEVITEHRTKHSKKPYQIRNRISAMFPEQNKIELFARERFDGWTSWGNEVTEGQVNENLIFKLFP